MMEPVRKNYGITNIETDKMTPPADTPSVLYAMRKTHPHGGYVQQTNYFDPKPQIIRL
jgi:hypothetical protein